MSMGLPNTFSMRLLLGMCFFVVVMGWDLAHRGTPNPPAQALWPDLRSPPGFLQKLRLRGQGQIPMPPHTPAAHASSLVAMPVSHPYVVLAFWFAGTKESAPDVGIAASGFDRAMQQWQPAQMVVNRHDLGLQLGFAVRRLGNPVAWLDATGKVHLFVVATGLGGWAASRIVQLSQRQTNSALSFDVVRVLPLSWWWNTSFLVRTAPLALQDGGMVLPVYFELGLKYPVALRFDAIGAFKGMTRMSARTYLLQPTIIAQNATHWLALLRNQQTNGKIAVVQTQDGGQHWDDGHDLNLVNPDASVAALALSPGQMWLAHNSSPNSRHVLDLSYSVDGQHWQRMQTLAQSSGTDVSIHDTEEANLEEVTLLPNEFSYPSLAWADNSLWVSYTHQRSSIAWQRFSVDGR
jgi:predicted neuraminidase